VDVTIDPEVELPQIVDPLLNRVEPGGLGCGRHGEKPPLHSMQSDPVWRDSSTPPSAPQQYFMEIEFCQHVI
jgi:hypothetical protein